MVIGRELIDFYDPERDVTTMGQNTTYPTSIVSKIILRGELKEKGVLHCVKIGRNPKTAEIFFKELVKRNIIITESMSISLEFRI